MSLTEKNLKLCSCNGTIPLDPKALAAALKSGTPLTVHRELCRKEAAAFQAGLGEDRLVVACTQEAPLFLELQQAAGAKGELRFANIREAAGWSAEGKAATPKMAALIAAAALPEPDPVPSVEYKSGGQLLVIGPSGAALEWARRIAESYAGTLEPSVLITHRAGGELPIERGFPVFSGRPKALTGYLGAFQLKWELDNAIDLELCTRCNACVDACPEDAIDFLYQIDPARCKAHRKCVAACGAIGAIDFSRAERSRSESFDLVLDLSAEPLLRMPDLPQGYAAPRADPLEQSLALAQLARLVGEFEKPKFFDYTARICAHRRSEKAGCSRCLDVCSTGAISEDGDGVKIEPHLCAGCGGCSTVCPSGAMRYAYPALPHTGMRLKAMLGSYRDAGGKDACVVFHDLEGGRTLVHSVGRRAGLHGRGLPARAIPFEAFHVASTGIDALLGAICYGASQAVVVARMDTPESYVAALEAQMGIAEAILQGLGYEGVHFSVVRAADAGALEQALWALAPARTVTSPAAFNLAADKRTALDFEIEHLAKHAPRAQTLLELPVGAPFGALLVDKGRCTLCKACIGACPASALLDAPESPSLRFIERNCVQCGLCANTCPENAIKLQPRLLLAPEAKQPVTLMEAEPFNCVRCGKPFGTRQMVENMLGKLGGHSMYAAGGLRRLQMCADCRVIDMMENKDESSIFDFTGKRP